MPEPGSTGSRLVVNASLVISLFELLISNEDQADPVQQPKNNVDGNAEQDHLHDAASFATLPEKPY
jgi:hypothetical protein